MHPREHRLNEIVFDRSRQQSSNEERPGFWWRCTIPITSDALVKVLAMHTVASSRELATLMANYEQLLLLGIFSWSNYSRETQLDLQESESLFKGHGIGLAAFELGEPHDVARVCPTFLRHFLFAVTEPACLLLRNGTLVAVRFGRITAVDALAWVLTRPTLSPTPDFSAHPHPGPIAISLEVAITDDDESVRLAASEILRELNWPSEAAKAKSVLAPRCQQGGGISASEP